MHLVSLVMVVSLVIEILMVWVLATTSLIVPIMSISLVVLLGLATVIPLIVMLLVALIVLSLTTI